MTKLIKLSFICAVIGLISACNSTFKSNVSRFHELPQPQGESVVIVASDPAKNTSLEFASYANIVGGYLAKQGYVPAGDGKPDLIVELDYSVDDGKVMVRSTPSHFSFGYGYASGFYPYYSPWYRPYWRHGYYGRYGYSPFWFDHHERNVRSYVNYTRKLMLTIRPNKDGVKNIFEGTVESRGRNNKLPELMPHMVQAMFTNFPGTNGTTDKVVIELEKP